MTQGDKEELHMHFVCTREEAEGMIEVRDRFWVSDCGCRVGKGHCERSRTDVCLGFREDYTSTDSGRREITRAEVAELLALAREKHLVTRPFRDEEMSGPGGICFCCDDCCGYFQTDADSGEPVYVCDKGALREQTDMDSCTQCGDCADVCYFGARKMHEDELTIDREKCYGCGLCRDVCGPGCIEMVGR